MKWTIQFRVIRMLPFPINSPTQCNIVFCNLCTNWYAFNPYSRLVHSVDCEKKRANKTTNVFVCHKYLLFGVVPYWLKTFAAAEFKHVTLVFRSQRISYPCVVAWMQICIYLGWMSLANEKQNQNWWRNSNQIHRVIIVVGRGRLRKKTACHFTHIIFSWHCCCCWIVTDKFNKSHHHTTFHSSSTVQRGHISHSLIACGRVKVNKLFWLIWFSTTSSCV
jgi:hypothetical protein